MITTFGYNCLTFIIIIRDLEVNIFEQLDTTSRKRVNAMIINNTRRLKGASHTKFQYFDPPMQRLLVSRFFIILEPGRRFRICV